jgi:pimeloyl-ACP methyl ester carboxylesterase
VSCARALGFTPLHLNYNSGHHISINGRELADRLEQLVAQWPVPVTDLALVGHSMGGLVARSACHYAAADPGRAQHARAWRSKLRALIFLGTPHHGAPLERGGSWVDLLLGASPYSAPFARLGQLRSAGITDLRHGNLIDDDWHGHDRFMRHDQRVAVPLPADLSCHAVAGSLGRSAGDRRERVLGDGLVPVASALGRHANATRALHFRQEHTRVMLGRSHLDLLGDRDVLTQVHDWLAAAVGQAR